MPGVPVDVALGGNLVEELEYGNHPGVRHRAEVTAKKVVTDVVRVLRWCSTRLLFRKIRGVRLPPVKSVVKEPKLRIIHDLTFSGFGSQSSVNEDTD